MWCSFELVVTLGVLSVWIVIVCFVLVGCCADVDVRCLCIYVYIIYYIILLYIYYILYIILYIIILLYYLLSYLILYSFSSPILPILLSQSTSSSSSPLFPLLPSSFPSIFLPFPNPLIQSIRVGTYLWLFIFSSNQQFDPACFIGVDG